MVEELVKSVALLLALCFLHGFIVRLWRRHAVAGQVVSGFLFGGICILGMLMPLVLMPGVIFDARSVVLCMAGLFGGPLVGLIAATMTAAWRGWVVGGDGAGVGIMMAFVCVAMGLAYREARARGWVTVQPLHMLGFGLVVHLVVVGMFQFTPPAVAARINDTVAVPYLIVFTLATPLLGWLLHDVERRLETEAALVASEARLRAVTQALPDVLLLLDEDGRYLEVLSARPSYLVARSEDLIGRHMHEVLPPDRAAEFLQLIRKTLAVGETQSAEYTLDTLSGPRHFDARVQPLGMRVGGRLAVVLLARDVTARHEVERALHESELRFRTVLRNLTSISVQGYRADGTTSYWNHASERLYGYTEAEALGRNLLDLIIPPPMHDAVRADMARMFATGEAIPAGELRLRRKDGSEVEVFSSHVFIHVPGQDPEMFCIDIDISDRKAAEEEARYLACYDPLTQLPNRRMLLDRLQQVMAGSARSGHYLAVLFVDLDNFKTLNDTRGHETGDRLLQSVAQRLRAGVREHDTVARLGGDEFVVVLEDLSDNPNEAATQTRSVAEGLLLRLYAPYDTVQADYRCTASIGATLTCGQDGSVEDLLKQADLAMYRAKTAGRNALRFFDPDMQQAMNRRAQLEAQLHNALRLQQFLLLYQPQVDTKGGVRGVEVLVRWSHPEQGMVSPGEFIPLAEDTGLILPLGHWVMETAMRQQAQWRRDPLLGSIDVSINVSARQFHQEHFVQMVQELLQRTGADPRRIQLELTESLLLDQVDAVIATMQALRALGVGFALDDFGTGYSSLSYLKRLPLDVIKIDQGFVRDLLDEPRDASIARTIIALADALSLGVVAEGIETEAHFQFLQSHGCKRFQGYLFGRPMPLPDFEDRARQCPYPPA